MKLFESLYYDKIDSCQNNDSFNIFKELNRSFYKRMLRDDNIEMLLKKNEGYKFNLVKFWTNYSLCGEGNYNKFRVLDCVQDYNHKEISILEYYIICGIFIQVICVTLTNLFYPYNIEQFLLKVVYLKGIYEIYYSSFRNN